MNLIYKSFTALFILDLLHTTLTAAPLPTVVVKKIALTNRTAAVLPITLFTPSANGMYRVSSYLRITKNIPDQEPSTSVYPYLSFYPSDAFVISYTQLGYLNLSSNGDAPLDVSVVTAFTAKANHPIKVSVGLGPGGNAGGGTYDLFVVLERIW